MRGNEEASDAGFVVAAIFGLIIGLVMLIFWLFKSEILSVMFWLKSFEARYLLWGSKSVQQALFETSQQMRYAPSLEVMQALLYKVGMQLNYVIIPAGITCIGVLAFAHPRRKYRLRHSQKTLAETAKPVHPLSALALRSDTIKEKAWDSACSPYELAVKEKLTVKREGGGDTLHRHKASHYLTQQLGRRATLKVPADPLICVVQSILTCYVIGNRRLADHLAVSASQIFSVHKNLNKEIIGHASKIWKKHAKDERVRQLFDRHAYQYTFLCGLFDVAKAGGIVHPARFQWVKLIDRRLWYILNNLGRKSVFIEGVSVISHYEHERLCNRPLVKPVIEAVLDEWTYHVETDSQ